MKIILIILMILFPVIKYNNEIESPKKFGIDISHHQGNIDWKTVRSKYADNIEFIYVKASEGATYKDSKYKYNITEAKKAGFNVGAYHYFTMTSSAEYQFKNFCQCLDDVEFNLIPMIDVEVEYTPISKLQDSLLKMVTLIKDKYGVYPMIYGTMRSINTIYTTRLNKCPFYIGRYGKKPVTKEKYTIWQYTEKGKLDGISKSVDKCVFNKNKSIKDISM